MYEKIVELMGMMFLLMVSGMLLKKKNLITDAGKKSITNLILYLILPCNIIKAFMMEIEPDFWVTFAQALLVAIGVQLLSMIGASVLYRKIPLCEKQVYQYATVCSNAGFMGNPLAQGVFGDLGLLYASVFLIPQRIVMWTAGVSYFTNEDDKGKAVRKVLVHPCMIAVYIGLILMLGQIPLPAMLTKSISSMSSCCTGLTMVYIGTILADVDFRTLCSKKQLYFAGIRLIGIPAVVFACCLLLHIDPLVMGVCTLLAAAPAGSTTSILASKYGADEAAAAKCVVFTTALSVITIPVWSAVLLGMQF